MEKNIKGVLPDAVLKQELSRIEAEEISIRASMVAQTDDNGSPEEAIAYASEYLQQPSLVWKKAGFAIRNKLQWFQFPLGTTYENEIFGTTKISSVFSAKDLILSPLSTIVVIRTPY